MVTPILQKGQRRRDVYLPESISIEGNTHNDNSKTSSRVKTDSLLSTDSKSENTKSKTLKDTKNENAIVWKQMGTAKGAGKLHMGGKWLKNIEVNQLCNHVFKITCFYLI